MSTNKNSAPEVPAQEQPKITFDYGVIETSRFYITTDKSFYESMKENPKFVSMFTPEYLEEFKEGYPHVQDFQIYIFCISQEE
ncbi:hypothetical protein [Clostridium ganghwense]|uniref:Chloramphenicol acetyltransferase n=1 Tax=Clostridium ganghwense TaxID=312089 RepID=A0ABT4CW30_9CLOT|nr:hypothetical protein [Clostridium ganghwense]MCY6372416.1 hypothetical protein [Clostridium ganghwense]